VLPVPRPYQQTGIEALRAHVAEGRERVILVCPTGGGKTVLASAVIHSGRRNYNAKILFVAHRRELIEQTVKQLARWDIHEVGVIRADDERTNALMPIQVATIQSLARRNPPPADIVFVDECHRAVANSYRRLLAIYPNAIIIGLTATPCRMDGKALGDVFQAIEIAATYKDLIKDDFIVAPRCFGTPVAPKLDGVRTQHGDFVTDELADAMMESTVLGDTVAEYQKHAEGRRTVVFAVNVAHSKALLEKFLTAGVRAAHVDGETPEDERADISRKLNTGELEVVCNVAVYTEGWDEPCVKCLIIARPTKSVVLFVQMAGRVLRPWNGNVPNGYGVFPARSWRPEDGPSVQPIVIDQGGNLDRHGFPHEDRIWSLTGSAKRETEKKPTRCIKCLAYIKHYPCEACGYAPEVSPREIAEIPNAELQERVFVERELPVDPQRAFFERKVNEARTKGYKPTWVSWKFKEQFGDWPPWSWTQQVKEACQADEQWKRRMVNAQANRERWAQRNLERKSEDTPRFDTDEDFADWARRDS
jgi:DNA repair protein RadD